MYDIYCMLIYPEDTKYIRALKKQIVKMSPEDFENKITSKSNEDVNEIILRVGVGVILKLIDYYSDEIAWEDYYGLALDAVYYITDRFDVSRVRGVPLYAYIKLCNQQIRAYMQQYIQHYNVYVDPEDVFPTISDNREQQKSLYTVMYNVAKKLDKTYIANPYTKYYVSHTDAIGMIVDKSMRSVAKQNNITYLALYTQAQTRLRHIVQHTDVVDYLGINGITISHDTVKQIVKYLHSHSQKITWFEVPKKWSKNKRISF